ncbi:MAG TPA: TetR/AcrR family transcriptional regulator [Solirubrobacteraceae bacterium]|jgi:AcrR family transcriptional regulator|nr:TetR/AcrR family transcriptional regulator [Solirubrobacteraceae bacterium]
MPATEGADGRRTQAERRGATRLALLEAAAECLVEVGYARTTTRRVARRASVTPGALQHHFDSKADLLRATLSHIRARWGAEIQSYRPDATTLRGRHEQLLDRMWSLYRGPLFKALLELAVGARTDPELAAHLAGAHEEMVRLNAAGIPTLFPEHADHPEMVALVMTGQATMRGLILIGLTGDGNLDAIWPATRQHILALNALVLDDDRLR